MRYQIDEVKHMLNIATFLDPRLKSLPLLTTTRSKRSSQL